MSKDDRQTKIDLEAGVDPTGQQQHTDDNSTDANTRNAPTPTDKTQVQLNPLATKELEEGKLGGEKNADEEGEGNVVIVDWDGPDDPENPRK